MDGVNWLEPSPNKTKLPSKCSSLPLRRKFRCHPIRTLWKIKIRCLDRVTCGGRLIEKEELSLLYSFVCQVSISSPSFTSFSSFPEQFRYQKLWFVLKAVIDVQRSVLGCFLLHLLPLLPLFDLMKFHRFWSS